ncbi:Fur family transcriptional regulator [Malaciobacter molluscorum LMG 25693]|uniref:Fur family transcriptional regulator n=1 Tax=Malaciobacter molluscorum LMG 25693 TaxID=870501 RepID=A0A2G1DJ38_9BACT|nr:transcriptional repressor [Malaciobacter molluscorum]AXX91689.1 transcriptional regulator, Fur family [Malaciobacter molluscorum LMG 25693]PHO18515.1 Fur family transcriptional regulator [Malaciobacter molluscorum LMG 25693]RXJ94654.1 Fur family transcriptional regulator [Malaciobacter molluscorum]
MNVEKLIDNKNFKLTTARKVILEILIDSEKPLCYDDIKSSLSMDKATFYRNITKFEDENIINSFESNDKKRYYEIQNKPHAHFICCKCSNIECIPENIDFNLPKHKIDNIIIKGICPNCLKK